ncbi:hypothetical protein LDENG_00119440 [Lucifuga dentata]|nr:hypothetical protein LDENG_00119440 [Lucifuga dentata]
MSLKDYRPVALTSLVMKSFEKMVKEKILTSVQAALDPLQFAYRTGRGVEDATCTLLNLVLRHLEGSKNHARLLLIDFSSAFNCIQPHLLAKKLKDDFKMDFSTVCWLVDCLIDHRQSELTASHPANWCPLLVLHRVVFCLLFYFLYTLMIVRESESESDFIVIVLVQRD